MKNSWFSSFLLTAILVCGAMALKGCGHFGASKKTHKRICVVYSFAKDDPGQVSLDDKLYGALKEGDNPVSIYRFYLDCNNYARHDEENRMRRFLDVMHKWKPDLIVAVNDQATYSLLAVDDSLVHRVPVAFCDVNFPNEKVLGRYDNVWGVTDEPDYASNIKFINRVMGKSKVEVVYDRTTLGKMAYRKLTESVGGRFYIDSSLVALDTLSSNYLDMPTINEKSMRESNVVHDSTYVNLFPFRCSYGRVVLQHFDENSSRDKTVFLLDKYDIISSLLTEFYNYPIFSVTHKRFDSGHGIIGGYFATEEELISSLMRIVRDINDKPHSKPYVVKAVKSYNADYEGYSKWDIKTSVFPSGTLTINVPWRDKYKTLLIIVLVVVGALGLHVVGNAFILRTKGHRHNMLVKLMRGERKNVLMDIFGDEYVYWVYQDGCFILDDNCEPIFGKGHHVVPAKEFFAAIHPDDIAAVKDSVSLSLPGLKLVDYRLRKLDGTYEWYAIKYAVLHFGKQPLGVGFAHNVHRDKQASLGVSRLRRESSDYSLHRVFFRNFDKEVAPLVRILSLHASLKNKKESNDRPCRDVFMQELILSKFFAYKNRLVYDMQMFSQLVNVQNKLPLARCNIDSYLTAFVSQLQPDEKKHVMVVHPEKMSEVEIDTNKKWFAELISLCIFNARRFSIYEGVTVEMDADKERGELILTIRGNVYNQHSLPGVTEILNSKTYMIDKTALGLGMELPLCRLIAMRLGGVFAPSITKGNVLFTFVCPLRKEVAV